MTAIMAVVFAAAGMHQIDARSHITTRHDINANRRLLLTAVCWGAAVALVST